MPGYHTIDSFLHLDPRSGMRYDSIKVQHMFSYFDLQRLHKDPLNIRRLALSRKSHTEISGQALCKKEAYYFFDIFQAVIPSPGVLAAFSPNEKNAKSISRVEIVGNSRRIRDICSTTQLVSLLSQRRVMRSQKGV
jgi:hypothetical protein